MNGSTSDNLLRDAEPWLERDSHPATGAGWLAILNPNLDRAANATLAIYSDKLATEPVERRLAVPPGSMELIQLHALAEVPRNEFFGIGLRSDSPVIPQTSWFEFRPWRPTPRRYHLQGDAPWAAD